MQTKRNQYLREMGIDVWVERGTSRRKPRVVPAPQSESAGSVRPAPEAPAEKVRPADSRKAPAPPVSSGAKRAPVPDFHLCFATYGKLSLIFSVPTSASALPDDLRRFVDDIATSLGKKEDPVINALRWPMVKSADIDQSEEAARAVLAERTARLAPVRIIFGETAQVWTRQGGETLVEDIGHYLIEPLAKRALWQTIRGLAG